MHLLPAQGVHLGDARTGARWCLGTSRWGSNICVSHLMPETCHRSDVNSWGQCEPPPADERLSSCWVFGEITSTKPLQASTECLQLSRPGEPGGLYPPCLQFVCVAPLRIDMLYMNGDTSKRLNRPWALPHPPKKRKTLLKKSPTQPGRESLCINLVL